ncbi:hypothetical protein GCM10025876_37210 [Demequina litorisediminis]|uniref:(d)CMP kinase n=1 Tax=Demequina litorisediminis TaxID=1849022 RepID=A0ABQ6IK32_9MICO|nr:hypothetical protein GCM10025876_37210 [Demequina litorisediminis]
MTGIAIAIDGPAGTGKSTVSREVAKRLKLAYFDTGATYRVATLTCLREGVDLANAADVAAMVATMNVELILNPANPRALLDGEDVSSLIRTDTVALTVSKVATNLEARPLLQQMQRDVIAAEPRRRLLRRPWRGGRGPRHHHRDRPRSRPSHPHDRRRRGPRGTPRGRGRGRGHRAPGRSWPRQDGLRGVLLP